MSTWFIPLVEQTTGNDYTNSENDSDHSVNANTSDFSEPLNYPAEPIHNPAAVNEPVNTPQHYATPWTPRIEEDSALGRSAVPTLQTPYWTLGGVPVPESWRPNPIANLDDIYLGNSQRRPSHPPPPPPSACFGFVRAPDGCPVYIPVPPGWENIDGDPIPRRDSSGNLINHLPVLSEDDFLYPYELDNSVRRAITPTQYETMPVATRRQPSGTAEPVASRKTGFPAATGVNKRKRPVVDDDPFASDDENERGKGKRKSSVTGESDIYTVDLTEQAPSIEEKAADPKEDKRIKLGRFMCAICMDDVTNLTVTHCGHCFCLKCLHQSLYAETTRHRCPMCRTKVDMKARQEYTNKTKGFFPLELKLMTKTKKAKQPSSSASSSASSSFSSAKG